MQFTRRHVVIGALGAAALGAIAYFARPKPLEVEIGTVSRGPLRVTVDADGRTRVRHRYVVTAPVSGHLARIALAEGDSVARSSIVARLAPLPLDSSSTSQARARLAGAEALAREAASREAQSRASAADADRDLDRARVLETAGAISPRQREQAELTQRLAHDELAAAESRVRAADAEVRVARAALDTRGSVSTIADVRAPTRGRVLRVFEPNERVVAAGTPLVEIGDPTDIEVVVDVLSTDAVKIEPGAPAWLDEWGGDSTLEACVRRIEPSAVTRVSALGVDEQRVDVVLDLTGGRASLGDGYRVDVKILVWEGQNVLSVPSSAVFRSGDDWQLYVVSGGRAHRQVVTVGHRSAATVEITRGVDEGAPVILFPSDRIVDGVRVRGR